MNEPIDETQFLFSSEDRVFNGSLEGVSWYDEDGNRIENENLNEYFNEISRKGFQNAMQKYSPIGTVVRVREKIGLYMIVGYKYKMNEVVFDYLAVKFPSGITNNQSNIFGPRYVVFNHDEITQFHHIGLHSDIQNAFKERLLAEDDI